jgi:ubiquinone/menaquinone biosynthesis C-methylase UbiE
MTPQQARSLIKDGILKKKGNWADIGAGTGTFTLALRDLLESGTIYTVDKSPHVLWRLESTDAVRIEVVEGDFNHALDLPKLDGMIMANALHYSDAPEKVLKNLLHHLKPGGVFILIEYETTTPRPPWVPYPIPFAKFREIVEAIGLTKPVKLAEVPSRYGHQGIYAAYCLVPSSMPGQKTRDDR